MDILLALTYYWPHRTGLTLHAQYVAEGLAARGHKVTVLTSHFLDSLPREQTLNGVRVVRLRCLKRVSRGQLMPGYPLAAHRLLQEHDVVSIHSPMLESALLAGMAKRMHKGVVITHHGDLILPHGLLNSFIVVAMERLFHLAARNADAVIAYSDDYAEHSAWIKPHIEKTSALYPPVRMAEPSPDGRDRMRRSLG